MTKTFINWLEEKYIAKNEDNGLIITKDNVETMFDRYLSELELFEVIELADKYVEEIKKEYIAKEERGEFNLIKEQLTKPH